MSPPVLKTWLAELGHPKWLTAAQINEQQNHSSSGTSQHASDWKHDDRIYSVTINNHEYFPAYQFDSCCQPLPVIREILAALAPLTNSEKIAAWFYFPNGWISNDEGLAVAPQDALDRPSDVIAAARRNQTTYVA
ncbi:hypothetical protein [Paraburkholderia fungorum]|uniref:hypothetical protein n=1 Tax=Paraburkholderia fungorum TaxID=134537 RepID=UPI0009423A5A|nr:hypothetical protein [Paraburkholderia fungorum]